MIFRIDLDLIIVPYQHRPIEQPANQLWLVRTGDEMVDGVERHYYAVHPPLRALLVFRNNLDVDDFRDAPFAEVLVGWDDGDNPFVLHGQEGKRHTKISFLAAPYHLPHGTEPKPLSKIIRQAPRADRPGGNRGGAGRPRLAVDDATEAHNVTLPSRLWRRIEALGGGNHSAGIRRLAELAGWDTATGKASS